MNEIDNKLFDIKNTISEIKNDIETFKAVKQLIIIQPVFNQHEKHESKKTLSPKEIIAEMKLHNIDYNSISTYSPRNLDNNSTYTFSPKHYSNHNETINNCKINI